MNRGAGPCIMVLLPWQQLSHAHDVGKQSSLTRIDRQKTLQIVKHEMLVTCTHIYEIANLANLKSELQTSD